MERRVIICGGGTGGHFYPALVVGRKLLDLDGDLQLTYVGTHRDVEKKIMEEQQVRFHPLRIQGLKGRGIRRLPALFLLPLAFAQSLALLLTTRPSLVIGAGGYSSGPVVLLAAWLGIPTVILEQNSRPGFTNRVLARWIRKAVVAFDSALPYFKGKAVRLGNPVREEFYSIRRRREADGLNLLIFGGSQGSRFLNTTMTEALPILAPRKQSLHIVHQTGKQDLAWVTEAYRNCGFYAAEVSGYLPGMASCFEKADLILSRAGATTVAEIIAAGRAAVLVPFAGAADDHQTANARELERAGAAELIPEGQATAEVLAARILHFLGHKDDLEAMESALLPLKTRDASEKIAGLCLSLMAAEQKEMRA